MKNMIKIRHKSISISSMPRITLPNYQKL